MERYVEIINFPVVPHAMLRTNALLGQSPAADALSGMRQVRADGASEQPRLHDDARHRSTVEIWLPATHAANRQEASSFEDYRSPRGALVQGSGS